MDAIHAIGRPRPSANRRCIVILQGCGVAGGNTADTLKNHTKRFRERLEI